MKKKHKQSFFTFIVLCSIYLLMGYIVSKNMFYVPSIEKVDLTPLLEQSSFSQDDYLLLFQQTGLTQPIIDELKETDDFKESILRFQANYLKSLDVQKTNMNPLTRIDQAFDAHGNTIKAFELAPYHNGYIFLTKSTYTANWRHGHAGLVVDEKRGKVLESLEPGTVSMEQDASKWEYYPTFKMMRLKDTPQSFLDEVANYASTHLMGIPYHILTMKSAVDTFKTTHCSFIVWQAFKAFDIDLDATGGIFVSPQDLAKSPYLETLQIFGFHPERDW